MPCFETNQSQVMRDAIQEQIVLPVPELDMISKKALVFAATEHKKQRYWQKDPITQAQTQRYIESVLPVISPNITGQPWVAELARIPVPRGSVGYLKSIEQFIQDAESNFYPTSSEYWGIPHHSHSDVDNCRWLLRLETFEGTIPPRFFRLPAPPNPGQWLPGAPNWDLAEWQDIWFPPHCAAKWPNMVIPGGYILRFYFYTPATTTFNWQAMGKLRATIQTALCVEARYNTRINSW